MAVTETQFPTSVVVGDFDYDGNYRKSTVTDSMLRVGRRHPYRISRRTFDLFPIRFGSSLSYCHWYFLLFSSSLSPAHSLTHTHTHTHAHFFPSFLLSLSSLFLFLAPPPDFQFVLMAILLSHLFFKTTWSLLTSRSSSQLISLLPVQSHVSFPHPHPHPQRSSSTARKFAFLVQ